jgi:hypothetical protein
LLVGQLRQLFIHGFEPRWCQDYIKDYVPLHQFAA